MLKKILACFIKDFIKFIFFTMPKKTQITMIAIIIKKINNPVERPSLNSILFDPVTSISHLSPS